MAVLDVKGICKTFDKNTVVLRGIDFSLEKGESVAVRSARPAAARRRFFAASTS